MRKGVVLIVAAALALFAFSLASAEKEVEFGGKIYAHWYYDLSDALNAQGNISDVDFASYNAFGVSRAYIFGTAKLSEKTSGKLTIDINPDNTSASYYHMRLKFAYLKWNFYTGPQLGLAAKFGLHETPWNDGMEKIWGRRYIEKTPTDQLDMLTTSDNGISLIGDLGEKGKWGWADLSIFNGASYSSPWDNNPSKDIDIAAFLTPLNSKEEFANSTVGFQYYIGTHNDYNDSSQTKGDFKNNLMSIVANFQYKKTFALGVEYNSLGFKEDTASVGAPVMVDNKENSMAIFGTLWFEELAQNTKMLRTLDVFFRYLTDDPDAEDLVDERKGTELIVGVECVPVKGFAASLNYRTDAQKDLGAGVDDITNSYLFLNTLFEF